VAFETLILPVALFLSQFLVTFVEFDVWIGVFRWLKGGKFPHRRESHPFGFGRSDWPLYIVHLGVFNHYK
jgi:hypothetical protein